MLQHLSRFKNCTHALTYGRINVQKRCCPPAGHSAQPAPACRRASSLSQVMIPASNDDAVATVTASSSTANGTSTMHAYRTLTVRIHTRLFGNERLLHHVAKLFVHAPSDNTVQRAAARMNAHARNISKPSRFAACNTRDIPARYISRTFTSSCCA